MLWWSPDGSLRSEPQPKRLSGGIPSGALSACPMPTLAVVCRRDYVSQCASPGPPGTWSLSAEMPVPPPLPALQVKALGYDGNSPSSVPSWLDSLGLQDYVHSFLSSGYSSIDTVKNLWELELVNVSVAPARPGCSPSRGCLGLPAWPRGEVWRLGVPWASPTRTLRFPSRPGSKGSPARPSQAHHRLPCRQALRGAAPEAPAVFPA